MRSGAQPLPSAAAQLVRRRELPAHSGGLGGKQAAGGSRPHQPVHHLRQGSPARLSQSQGSTPGQGGILV